MWLESTRTMRTLPTTRECSTNISSTVSGRPASSSKLEIAAPRAEDFWHVLQSGRDVAYVRRANGLAVTSLAYGTWDKTGMTTTIGPATRAHLAQLRLNYRNPAIRLDLLEHAVLQEHTLSAPAVLDLPKLESHYQSQDSVPPLRLFLLHGVEATEPALFQKSLLPMVQTKVGEALGDAGPNHIHPIGAL